MSSTSKGPRPRANAPGEVVTNWAVVRIVVGLVILAALGIGFSARSRPQPITDANRAPTRAKLEPLVAAAEEPRELPEELVVVEPREPQIVVASQELPPGRSPRPPGVPEPEPRREVQAVVLVSNGTGPASTDEFAARPQVPVVLVTLDERALLRQLGFNRQLDPTLDELSASGQVPLSVVGVPGRDPHIADLDLDTEKGTIQKLHKMVEEFSPRPPIRLDRRTSGTGKKQISNDETGSPAPPKWAKNGAPADAWLDLFAKRADLHGLPYRKGAGCKLDDAAAASLGALSQQVGRLARFGDEELDDVHSRHLYLMLRGVLARSQPKNNGPGEARSIANEAERMDQLVPGVLQMYQVRSIGARQAMLDFVGAINGKNATAALAHRALFDLSKPLREAAVKALAHRPPTEVRPHLLAGLRYPWAAIADHAAEALVALDHGVAVPELARLLDEPDPAAPFVDSSGKWAVRELVRVNHLRNCFLCHAPSLSSSDPVRGLVPIPGQELPRNQYYQSLQGVFVRADVTYLKQDFSLMHPVETPDKWPKLQRFDYLVRTRGLTAAEAKQLPAADVARGQKVPDEQNYPQREAVIYALRRLTGLDGGKSARQWRELVQTGSVARAGK